MKDWQFNVIFVIACSGAIVLLFGDKIGVSVKPEVVTVFGAIMAFVLTQKRTTQEKPSKKKKKEEDDDG